MATIAGTLVRGFKYPFQKVGRDLPASATDETSITDSLIQLISTPKRTRVMRPSFGVSAYDWVFEPNNNLLAENIRSDVATVVGRYEPRVLLRSVDVIRDEDTGRVDVVINYVIRSTRQERQIILPLYSGS